MATPPVVPLGIPIELYTQIFGGATACLMVMLVFYGISVLQSYMYFITYAKDPTFVRTMVAVLAALALAHAILIGQGVYHYLIDCYGNPTQILNGYGAIYAGTLVNTVIIFIVQAFYSRTIYYLCPIKWRKYVMGLSVGLLLGSFALGIEMVVKEFTMWDLDKLQQATYTAIVPAFASRVLCDSITAIALSVLLWDKKTNFSKSTHLLRTLIVYAVNRFLLTALVSIAQVIVLVLKPATIWAMAIEWIKGSLYVNSLLATLNSRNYLREGDRVQMSIAPGTGTTYDQPSFAVPSTFPARSGTTVDEEHSLSIISGKPPGIPDRVYVDLESRISSGS